MNSFWYTFTDIWYLHNYISMRIIFSCIYLNFYDFIRVIIIIFSCKRKIVTRRVKNFKKESGVVLKFLISFNNIKQRPDRSGIFTIKVVDIIFEHFIIKLIVKSVSKNIVKFTIWPLQKILVIILTENANTWV